MVLLMKIGWHSDNQGLMGSYCQENQ